LSLGHCNNFRNHIFYHIVARGFATGETGLRLLIAHEKELNRLDKLIVVLVAIDGGLFYVLLSIYICLWKYKTIITIKKITDY
jgi:hypothetical protein